MIQTEGVVHFTIPVNDLEESVAFYTQVLGMKEVQRTPVLSFLECGPDVVLLCKHHQPLTDDPADPGNLHHAFRISAECYDGARSFLEARGIPITKQDTGKAYFSGRSIYFKDPNGNNLEIYDGGKPGA